jgi:hypothetical protein
MNHFTFALLVASMMAASEGFAPTAPTTRPVPFFVNVLDRPVSQEAASPVRSVSKLETETPSMPTQKKKTPPKKAAGGHAKTGLFAPVVLVAKNVLGEEQLNKIRGKVIAEHSKVIGSFVETSKTEFGETALRTLFQIADANKNGSIEEHELVAALQTLGFDHLKEKQIKGIFERADKDANGAIDWEEFRTEAPSTLRTNLIKLAKRNGGDLGFLA